MTPTKTEIPRPLYRLAGLSLLASLQAAPVGIAFQLLLTVLVGTFPALAAWFGKLFLDELARGVSSDARLTVIDAITSAGFGALAAIGGKLISIVAEHNRLSTATAMEARLFGAVNRMVGLRQFDHPVYHDRLTLAQQSIDDAPAQVSGFATDSIRTAVGIVGFFAMIVRIWPPLLILVATSAALALWAEAALASAHAAASRATAPIRRRHAALQLMLLNPIAAKEIRLYRLGDFFHARMMLALRDRNRVDLGMARRDAAIQCLFLAVGGLVMAVGTIAVASRVHDGLATVGDVGFLIAAIAGLQSSVSGVIEGFGRTIRALRLFDHFVSIGATADLPRGHAPVAPLQSGIELRDVWFRYDHQHPWILRGASFTIPYGKAVGLVGLNGAGKSTLAKLLCRFYDPEHGQILWDGVDFRDLDADQLRARIAATYQEHMTFDVIARESIGLGDLSMLSDQSRIEAAARLAEIHDTIARLPRGYDTMLSSFLHGEEADDNAGVLLSGGQWQRVAVARSLMHEKSDLLILDEPSSGLDPVAEYRIHTMLNRQRRGRTTFMISHRLSAMREADIIIVLADGVVTERGNHNSLVARGGGYAELFALQAAGYQSHPSPTHSTDDLAATAWAEAGDRR